MSNKKLKIKISHGLKQPPIKDFKCNNQQKTHTGMTEEWKARRFDRGGAWGKRDSIILVAKESEGM